SGGGRYLRRRERRSDWGGIIHVTPLTQCEQLGQVVRAYNHFMSEINFSPPGTASLSSSAPVTAPHMSLTALQPLETMLAPSQRAQGEVIAQRDLSSGQHLTLRLTLPDGRTAQLQVRTGDSPALPAGSQLQLTAQAGNRLLASLVTTAEPPLQRLDLSQLPAGSLLQARVLSNTPNSVTNLQ